ncbi:hypothetical protein BDR26DRAFT_263950 [Obelidium mucronatum]|nr:hypothetical protein BDR26DRAFT_263950 [Obelidium mucronatum]
MKRSRSPDLNSLLQPDCTQCRKKGTSFISGVPLCYDHVMEWKSRSSQTIYCKVAAETHQCNENYCSTLVLRVFGFCGSHRCGCSQCGQPANGFVMGNRLCGEHRLVIEKHYDSIKRDMQTGSITSSRVDVSANPKRFLEIEPSVRVKLPVKREIETIAITDSGVDMSANPKRFLEIEPSARAKLPVKAPVTMDSKQIKPSHERNVVEDGEATTGWSFLASRSIVSGTTAPIKPTLSSPSQLSTFGASNPIYLEVEPTLAQKRSALSLGHSASNVSAGLKVPTVPVDVAGGVKGSLELNLECDMCEKKAEKMYMEVIPLCNVHFEESICKQCQPTATTITGKIQPVVESNPKSCTLCLEEAVIGKTLCGAHDVYTSPVSSWQEFATRNSCHMQNVFDQTMLEELNQYAVFPVHGVYFPASLISALNCILSGEKDFQPVLFHNEDVKLTLATLALPFDDLDLEFYMLIAALEYIKGRGGQLAWLKLMRGIQDDDARNSVCEEVVETFAEYERMMKEFRNMIKLTCGDAAKKHYSRAAVAALKTEQEHAFRFFRI